MPVQVGEGVNQYNTVNHVLNGEPASQTIFRRPSVNLENRTNALKIFVEDFEDLFIEHDHTGDGISEPGKLLANSLADLNSPNGVCGLDSFGKVPTSLLPDAVLGAIKYQGTWDAASNFPSILTGSASPSNSGFYYIIGAAGSTNVDGISDWESGDWIVSNGSTWEKVDNSTEARLQEIVALSFTGKAGYTLGVAGDGASVTLINTGGQIASLQLQVNDLVTYHNQQHLQISQVNSLIAAVRLDLNHIMANEPVEEVFSPVPAGPGQSTFTATTISWLSDVNFLDIVVDVNGEPQIPNVDYIKLSTTSIKFIDGMSDRFLPEDSVVRVRIEIPNINTPLAPQPYFVEYIDGVTGMAVNMVNDYDPTKSRLSVYKNGQYLVNSPFIGGLADRFSEQDSQSVLLGVAIESDDVVAFVNLATTPGYRQANSGLTGTIITVPTYTTGSNKLLVWRNGILMNKSAMGLTSEQYTESSATSITLAEAAVASDWFVFENRAAAPTWRQETIPLVGVTSITVPTYTVSDTKLLVWRNGLLIHNSLTLGTADMRYQESSTTSINLGAAVDGTDVIIAIYQ